MSSPRTHSQRRAPLEQRFRNVARIAAGVLGAIGVLGASTGCMSPAQRPQLVEYPGVLRRAEDLPHDVLWRQHITAFWGDGEQRGFDAVIQKIGGKLTVLGLSPTGSMGFAIVLENGAVELTNQMPEELPFAARNVLLDVQRSFYPWLPAPSRGDDGGTQMGEVDGELVLEKWRDGKIVERRFTRLDGVPEGTLTIHYEWSEPDWSVPSRAVLDSGWYGYRLEINTHEESILVQGEGAHNG